MKTQHQKYLIMLPMLWISLGLQAQTTYKVASDSEFVVAGTSSLHDWAMSSSSVRGEVEVTIEGDVLKDIRDLSVTIDAETLKSGKSGMDDNAYKALKTKKHPEITFSLSQVKSIVKEGGHYLINAEGKLTIAGETRTVSIKAKGYPAGNTIKFTGSKALKMTDFKVDPPTALLGTVKTGDEITINFTLAFKSKQS